MCIGVQWLVTPREPSVSSRPKSPASQPITAPVAISRGTPFPLTTLTSLRSGSKVRSRLNLKQPTDQTVHQKISHLLQVDAAKSSHPIWPIQTKTKGTVSFLVTFFGSEQLEEEDSTECPLCRRIDPVFCPERILVPALVFVWRRVQSTPLGISSTAWT